MKNMFIKLVVEWVFNSNTNTNTPNDNINKVNIFSCCTKLILAF